MQRTTDFVDQLRTAFPCEPIRAAGAFDDWGTTYPDAEPYMKALDGKRWDELDREYIVRRSDSLGFLGTRHLIAVLPVYLRAMVEDGPSSPAAGMLTLMLVGSAEDNVDATRFDALVDALTNTQRAAIARALHELANRDPEGYLGRAAAAAIEGFWKDYLPATS